MPKKKSTGMSQRQSFLDRGVVAENRAILRYNEELEREARRAERGESGREPAAEGRRGSGGSRPGGGPRSGPGTRPDRPQHDGRPQRDGRPPARREPPRAATPEQEAAVRAVLPAADADPVMAAGGARLVDRLVRGDRLSRASDIGWEAVVAVPAASERTATQWAAVRRSWAVVVDAVTAQWVQIHPDAQPQRSAVEELDRHVGRQRPRPPAKPRTRKPKPTPGPSAQPVAGAAASASAQVEDLIEVDVAWSAEEPDADGAPAGQAGGANSSTAAESVAADVAPKRRRRRGRRRSRRPGEPVSADAGAVVAPVTAQPESTASVEETGEQPVSEQSEVASEPPTAEPPTAEPSTAGPSTAEAVAEPLPEPMGSEVPPEPEPTADNVTP